MKRDAQPLRVVVAPDSVKESLSAAEVAAAIARGVQLASPDAHVVCVPMADGGEGSVDAVVAATGGHRHTAKVLNANGQSCDAAWALLNDGTAFIEMAAAAGLEQIPEQERRALDAGTFGVG